MSDETAATDGMKSFCTVSPQDDRARICFQGSWVLQADLMVEILEAGFPTSTDLFEDDFGLRFISTTMPIPALVLLLSRFFDLVEDLSPDASSRRPGLVPSDKLIEGKACLS